MQSEAACPICKGSRWKPLAEKEYRQSDYDLDAQDYVAKRMSVLFRVWFPGQVTVRLKSSLCLECGFVTNLPRVEEADIDAKYRHLEQLGQDYGSRETDSIEIQRSQRLFQHVKGYLPPRGRILDYGGGDGRLMTTFAEAGHACSLIDYNQSPRSYVEKLGDTLADLTAQATFDVIVCNHVIEHVANPVEVLTALGAFLQPQGVILVEVPMEIWRKPPVFAEPVTHVNFFSVGSMKRTFEESRLQTIVCKLTGYLHPSGRVLPAVLALGRPQKERNANCKTSGVREVMRYLEPSIFERLRRKWLVR